jgi:hypothetical protein
MHDLEDVDTPEVVALRQAIRACLLTGEDYRSLKEILATEDALLEKEKRAAGVPAPLSFREQYATYMAEQRGNVDGR